MDDGLDHKGQLIHDLHASTHHTSDANARFLARQLELAGHGAAASVPHPGVSRKDQTVTIQIPAFIACTHIIP